MYAYLLIIDKYSFSCIALITRVVQANIIYLFHSPALQVHHAKTALTNRIALQQNNKTIEHAAIDALANICNAQPMKVLQRLHSIRHQSTLSADFLK